MSSIIDIQKNNVLTSWIITLFHLCHVEVVSRTGATVVVFHPGNTTPPISAQTMRSEEHTSELQSRPHISYAVFCLKKKKNKQTHKQTKKQKNKKTKKQKNPNR